MLDSVDGFDVIECSRCGFKHIVPIPDQDEVEKLYRGRYYEEEKPLYLERYQEDLEWWNAVYTRWYELFEDILPASRRRILDIGSSPGFFLLCGKSRGWQAVGLEPSARATSFSRSKGLDIVEDFLDEKTMKLLGTFDLIHIHNVLEHVPDPAGMLRWIYTMLEPDGLISVIVPNDYNPLQKLLKEKLNFRPWWVAPPHHINYFSFESLEYLLESSGFAILRRSTTFPMEVFLFMGQNYVGDDSTGRRVHGMRKTFELNIARAGGTGLLADFYHWLAARGLGRESFVIAKRQPSSTSRFMPD